LNNDVAFYFQVPLIIFKREKEIARKLEFDGLYVSDDPGDDDIAGQWDRLVISCPSFPSNYWDKFVKKKVAIIIQPNLILDDVINIF